jgi:membrane-associated phospholipid phosphatase
MKTTNILFWQPKFDLLRFLSKSIQGRATIIFLNYFIWFFLFYISFVLIKFNTNIFWQLFVATLIGEFVEKYGKSHALWRRPLFQRNDATPVGLVDSWYKTGSFPSGHTIKAVYFWLFVMQYQQFNSQVYLSIVIPLLFVRILLGFHYPIDMIGGAFFGWLIWFISHNIFLPEYLTAIVGSIFNFVFLIK